MKELMEDIIKFTKVDNKDDLIKEFCILYGVNHDKDVAIDIINKYDGDFRLFDDTIHKYKEIRHIAEELFEDEI